MLPAAGRVRPSRTISIGSDRPLGQPSIDSEGSVRRFCFPAGTRKSTHFFNKITFLGHGVNKFFCHHLPQSTGWLVTYS
jgi:hypothetical protein